MAWHCMAGQCIQQSNAHRALWQGRARTPHGEWQTWFFCNIHNRQWWWCCPPFPGPAKPAQSISPWFQNPCHPCQNGCCGPAAVCLWPTLYPRHAALQVVSHVQGWRVWAGIGYGSGWWSHCPAVMYNSLFTSNAPQSCSLVAPPVGQGCVVCVGFEGGPAPFQNRETLEL
jgi:hypothetical protein